MGRCESLISIVPPTSAAFERHVVLDKLLTARPKFMESAEEERQGWEVVQQLQSPRITSAELACRMVGWQLERAGGSHGWRKGDGEMLQLVSHT